MKLYVSSTFEDLAACRQAVSLVARRLGLEDVTNEWYVAGTRPALEECRQGIAEADIYLGLVAWKYGYIPLGQDSSITELEYRAAVASGKPRLIFLLSEDAAWPRALMDRDVTRIDQFRAELLRQQTCYTFTTPHDLTEVVTEALNAHLPATPGTRPGELAPKTRAVYLARLQQSYSEMEPAFPYRITDSVNLVLSNAFVEPAIREGVSADELADKHDVMPKKEPSLGFFATVAAPSNRKLVVLGDPGSGKSTIIRYLALSLARTNPGSELSGLEGYLPFVIQLRVYASAIASGRCNDFMDYLDFLASTEDLGIPKRELLPFLKHGGKALFLFDGLDEIIQAGLRQKVSLQIAELADKHSQIRILVTSRIIGHAKADLERAGFAYFILSELNDARIGDFIRHRYEMAGIGDSGGADALVRRTLNAIFSSPVLRELAGNPLLLTILSAVGLDRLLSGTPWELYEQAATGLVERWDVNRYLSAHDVGSGFLAIEDKKELLRVLAYRMQTAGDNYIGTQQFLLIIEEYLAVKYQLNRLTAREIALTMVRQIKAHNYILIEHSPELYGFIHRTFMEYFCASAIIERFRSRDLTRRDLQKLALDHGGDPSGHRCWPLYLRSSEKAFWRMRWGRFSNRSAHPHSPLSSRRSFLAFL